MERTITTKFFYFSQNNSGGYFIQNDTVRAHLIIEAQNAKEAADKGEEIAENYSEYCSCCGQRWSFDWVDDEDGTETPTINGKPAKEYIESDKHPVSFGKSAVIYYCDGTKEFIESPRN